jgi:hypothetical protein
MKVTKDNAVVGLKVVLDKDSQFAGQEKDAEYGVIVDNETHFPATPKYLWVQVNWIRADGIHVSTNYYRIGDDGKFDLNVYEVIPEYVECIKGFNTDLSVNDFNVVGKIYEVESYNPKTYRLKLKGFEGSIAYITFDGNSESLVTDYKISDKASFETQQNPKETLVGRYLKTLVNNPVCIGMDIGEYLLITKYNHQDNTYDVTRVRDNHTGFGIDVAHLPKFEVMPVGFNLSEVKEESIEEDLISQAKQRYPIGTKYYVAHLTRGSYDNYNDIVDSHNFVWKEDCIMLEGSTKDGWSRVIYEKATKKWADIISQPTEEFKVGDWVVPLNDNTSHDRNIGEAYQIETLDGSKAVRMFNRELKYDGNGWIEIKDLRKATPEEIAKAQKLQRDGYIDQAFTSKYTKEFWTVDAAYSEEYPIFVEPKKQKYKFSEVEYLLKPINQQLDLPIVKKYKKKSIINL